MTTTICLKTLAAIAAFSSKEEARYYLGGVSIEVTPRCVTYVATDGHRLAARRLFVPEGSPDNTDCIGQWIIPAATCKALKIGKREDGQATLTTSANGPRSLILAYGNQSIGFEAIDGTFPDWRRVVPSTCSGSTTYGFNGEYLASVDKLGAALDLGKKTCHWNDNGPACFTFSGAGDVFAVLMPMRNDKASWDNDAPAWIKSERGVGESVSKES
jgi:DNA polymerase III subunit beta